MPSTNWTPSIRELAEANTSLAREITQNARQVDYSSYCCGILGHYLTMHQRFLSALFGSEIQVGTSLSGDEPRSQGSGKTRTAEEIYGILHRCQEKQWALAQLYRKVLATELAPELRELVEQQFRELQQAIAGFEYNFSLFRANH